MDSKVSLEELERQSLVVSDFASQLKSAKDRAESAGFKALELGRGSKAFNRAVEGLTGYINAINQSITRRIGEG